MTSPVEPASEPEPAPPEPAPVDPPLSEVAPAPTDVAPGDLPIPQPPVPAARSTSQAPVQPPAPPPTKPAPNDQQSADWHARVLGRLNAVKAYPASARARRQQGVTMIRLVIDRGGKVLDVGLERSSGFALLDREALALPGRAMPLPAPPDNVPGQRIELVVPVEFYF
ncbi:energy transducer TonB [Sphingomonas crocodyli]|uniref:Energy transducer TonB n=1 Tax=Sphingomonas crocodyli TaxID=1979270 RepID=A0A437MBX9_9SPHN|nr:energy transducer TonB [Sphingomonas crocodyli]